MYDVVNLAIRRGTPEVLECLLGHGADVNQRLGIKRFGIECTLLNHVIHQGATKIAARGTTEIAACLVRHHATIEDRDIKPCLDMFHESYLTRKGMDERQCPKEQFKKYLKEQLLHARAKKSKNFDKNKEHYEWLSREIEILINEFAGKKISGRDCVRIAARTVPSRIKGKLKNRFSNYIIKTVK